MFRIHLIFIIFMQALPISAVEKIPTPVTRVPPLDVDHIEFAQVLSVVVKPNGVDYATLRRDHKSLNRYRAQLAVAKIPVERNEKLSFIINAYNAETLALVIAKLPADHSLWNAWSIKDAGGILFNVWKAYSFEVGGQWYTLDQLEHAVLRPLGEPRIHLAINCASRSCPSIANEPFRAKNLEAQLEAVSAAFASSTYHLRLEKGALYINPILDWFGSDFTSKGGIRTFLVKRVPAGATGDYLASDKPLKFFDYDWRLNIAEANP